MWGMGIPYDMNINRQQAWKDKTLFQDKLSREGGKYVGHLLVVLCIPCMLKCLHGFMRTVFFLVLWGCVCFGMFWYVFNAQSCQDLHSMLKGHPIRVQWPLKAGLKPRTLSCDPSEPYIGAKRPQDLRAFCRNAFPVSFEPWGLEESLW